MRKQVCVLGHTIEVTLVPHKTFDRRALIIWAPTIYTHNHTHSFDEYKRVFSHFFITHIFGNENVNNFLIYSSNESKEVLLLNFGENWQRVPFMILASILWTVQKWSKFRLQ